MPLALLTPGTFTLGCNYWASHASTAMWSDWRPEVVERDLAALAAAGLTTLRVFPLWSDFQPLVGAVSGGRLRELLLLTPQGEERLTDTPAGRAGVSDVMLERFAEFAMIARRHRLDIIVGLITGWMSGRTFFPPVLQGRDLLTDPLSLQLQGRFVKVFVERFRDEPAVAAWDLGNECNCLGPDISEASAWTWTALISSTIRAADPGRPIISGMHSLNAAPRAGFGYDGWTIQGQAEHTDLLTTHPYPLWVRHTRIDPLDTPRTTAHAAAETRFYADLGGKPAFAEEIGTMGPLMGEWAAAARFVRVNLFSLWANDCRGFLWWCAFDQTRLAHPPYDWMAVERELGLLREDYIPKPMLEELTRFARLLPSLPNPLPPRRIDAVCVLTEGQDQWAVAYSAWVLAMQAKFTLRFVYAGQALPDAWLYLLPGVRGMTPLDRRHWVALLEKVAGGADLYASLDDGVLEPFKEVFGVRVSSRGARLGPTSFRLGAGEGAIVLNARAGLDLRLAAEPGTATLATAADGSAVVVRRPYGKGRVTLASFPVETQLTATPGAFHAEGAEPFHELYRLISNTVIRPFDSRSAALAITLHGGRWAVAVNHGSAPAEVLVAEGVRVIRWVHGGPSVAPHEAAVIEYTSDV
jgi:hypothetical protein